MALIDKETLFNLYIEQNKTQSEIGKMYNCDRKNISYYLNKYDIKKSKDKVYKKHYKEKPTVDQILKLVDDGYFLKEIAFMFGVNRGTITKILKTQNINMRNHNLQTQKQSSRMKTDNPFNDKEIKNKAITNSRKNKDANFHAKRSVFKEEMSFKEYGKKARAIAYYHYGRKVDEGYSIDHKYSVYDGYKNKVPLSIISKPTNLRLLTVKENATKNKNSIITLDELYKI